MLVFDVDDNGVLTPLRLKLRYAEGPVLFRRRFFSVFGTSESLVCSFGAGRFKLCGVKGYLAGKGYALWSAKR